jgi:predicted acylesterase/phospholipase RssA
MNFLNSKKYDTVCMSGGGIKCFSFIGVIEYLELNYNFNPSEINSWIGTSAGAILSYFYVLGYTTEDIKTFIMDFDFMKMEPLISATRFYY